MSRYNKILVPIDFSDCSRVAVDYARDLARAFGGSLSLLHVWEIPPYIPPEAMVGMPGQSAQTLSHTAHAHAEQQMKAFREQLASTGVEIAAARLESGDAARTIVDVADSGGFDLIVMGTHGRTGIGHLLMGSVAEKVVRRSHCPVLTVRQPSTTSA